MDISPEITFRTARSGGKGGQNVNKVETMVEGYFHVGESRLLTEEQKSLLLHKLSNKLNSEGFLQVRSQEERTQLGNKQRVIEKMNQLVEKSLQKKKARIATRPTKAMKERRLESKKMHSERKQNRSKIKGY